MSASLVPRLRAKAWTVRFISNPTARVLVALHVSPNAITLVGFALAASAAYLLSEGRIVAGGGVMLAGAAMDMLDGAVARLGGRASVFGAFLDSVMDRLGEAVVLFGLLVFYVRDAHALGTYLAFGVLTTALLVSYLRARAEGLGVPGDIGFMGRPERVLVLGAGLLAGFPLYALGVILVLASVTILQRAAHVWRGTRGG